jgi:hypothetical protein
MDPGDEAAASPLWAVYVSEAEKYDKSLVESWKSDMEGMLIFVSVSENQHQYLNVIYQGGSLLR